MKVDIPLNEKEELISVQECKKKKYTKQFCVQYGNFSSLNHYSQVHSDPEW